MVVTRGGPLHRWSDGSLNTIPITGDTKPPRWQRGAVSPRGWADGAIREAQIKTQMVLETWVK